MTVTDTTEHYEILDYLNVESGAWVNTGYTPNCTDRVHIKVRFDNTTGNKCLYCSRTMSGSKVVRTFTCFAISNKFRFDRNTNISGGNVFAPVADTDYTVSVDFSSLACKVNGTDAGTMAGAGSFTGAAGAGRLLPQRGQKR